jgi:RNA-directed DNA polymerase
VKGHGVATREPKDKLDASAAAGVNGPEGEALAWLSIDWRRVEGDVRRLRQRIFTASREGDLRKVRSLQKLMLRSRANALVAVRRVAEQNAGRMTAGIDGMTALGPKSKADLADWAQHRRAGWDPRPVKRAWVPKSGGRQRPLGIPVMRDRALQAVVLGALEPEWEARFEPRSYGFRPGRGCHDAIEAIFLTSKGRNPARQWALDADLEAAFDRIDHANLLAQLGSFPARGMVQRWLQAGVLDHGRFAPTLQGTPQGGIVSPVLMNIALHGMEQAAGVRYLTTGTHAGQTAPSSPVLIRYADDLVALCHSQDQAVEVKARLTAWLTPKGLAFNEGKTRVVHLDDGLDFLGYNVRRYHGKLLIKPSKAAVRHLRERLAAEVKALNGANATAVISKLNPIIRGWSAYYRNAVSSRTFSALDDHVWRLTYRWAVRAHPNKPKTWVISRHFGKFHPARQDHWTFGDRHSGRYLQKFSWAKIVRHQLVPGRASPDDPSLAGYWSRRRRRQHLPLGFADLRLLQAQHGRCPRCRGLLLHAEHEPQSPHEWQQWLTATRQAIQRHAVTAETGPGTSGDTVAYHLLHAHCARRHHTDHRNSPALPPTREPLRLA